ncbi:hypothetical protein ACPOLB_26925 [Rubrivivax sp. RP6-9]|uniref:hypothetical protein n=1 Tax=Rubrivivax sp. RP6-9 TaxID=3415750 RepID=UPI003CC5F2AD
MAGPVAFADLRQRFPGLESPSAELLLRLLVAQDGSTTRLCEALAGTPVHERVLSQRVTRDVPAALHDLLPGERFVESVRSLVACGDVLADKLVYAALDGVDASLGEQLQTGLRPVGRLLARRWVRREAVSVGPELLGRLWRVVGIADAAALRSYRLCTHEGPQMLVCEAFRGGLWRHARRVLRSGPVLAGATS